MGKTLLKQVVFGVLATFMAGLGYAGDYHFVTFNFPPHEYQDDQQRPRGAAVDTVQMIMDRLGHNITIEVLPWTRALKMVRSGSADAIFTAYLNPERQKFLDYSTEILIDQEVYFYRKRGSDFSFDGSLASISGLRVGIVSTISYGKVFEGYKSSLSLDKANQLSHNIIKLLKGRIDIFPSNRYVAEYTLNEMGLADQVERIPQVIERVPSYIAFTRQRDLSHLRLRFDEELHKMKASGEYARILGQYGLSLQ